MTTDNAEFSQNSFSGIVTAIAERNLFKLRGTISNISDTQRLIILQQLSLLCKDKAYLSKNRTNAEDIDSLINSIADSMSDKFLLKVFGHNQDIS